MLSNAQFSIATLRRDFGRRGASGYRRYADRWLEPLTRVVQILRCQGSSSMLEFKACNQVLVASTGQIAFGLVKLILGDKNVEIGTHPGLNALTGGRNQKR